MIGRQIGVYRIASLLGAGGMGQVYRARDNRLGRDVAIKVLPEAFASDPDRLLRFEHEAHVLASLNHPHIAAIYGFEECAGVRALVLELVEGLTLAEKLADGVPLPVPDALRIARQIAEGVEAAHAKGIVHRDLKPANIKVSSGGIAKVLDFGLAKAWIVDADACEMWTASTVTGHATRDGMILGTIGYMSPEQARGQRIDSKADIWAFGCVVFEMLAGRAAFAAETRSDSLARILERDPDWSALPAHTPARIRELLRRCLQKNPATRLGDLAEARTEIDASLASPFRNIQSVLQSVQWWVSRPMVSGALAAVVLIAAIAFVYRLRTVDAPLPQLANPIQVTSAVGVEAAPTFSPEARTIAYESKEAGNWDVWVAQVGGGPPANRTADHNGDDRYPSWSPDGRRIAFWSDRDGGGYYVIPAIGGAAARLIAASGTPFLHSAPEWSADGKRLAAVIYKGPEPRREAFIHIVSMIDRDVREISLTGTEELASISAGHRTLDILLTLTPRNPARKSLSCASSNCQTVKARR